MLFMKKVALLTCLLLLACNDEAPKENKVLGNEVAKDQDLNALNSEKALFVAKARRVVGDVDYSKSENDWKKMHQGNTVVEGNKIRTAVESDVQLAANDGTLFQIMENSNVTVSAALLPNSRQSVDFVIEKGAIRFDVQKQKTNDFVFRTGTATAAIRGTAGFVGNINGKMVASLNEGRVNVTNEKGDSTSVEQNQTLIVNESGSVKTMNLASSGTKALLALVDSVASASDTTDLEQSLQNFDNDYAAQKAAFEKKLKFKAEGVARQIKDSSVTLQAIATPGVIVEVLGEVDTVGADSVYQRTFTWGADSYGTKRFLAVCSDGLVEIPCYMWVTEYVEENAETEDTDGLEMGVKINGPSVEKIHLEMPLKQYQGKLKFALQGFSAEERSKIKNVVISRGGSEIETIDPKGLGKWSFERKIQIGLNKIANFEVSVNMDDGRSFTAQKTYEVYCSQSNHPGGKARNNLVPLNKEYEQLKAKGLLRNE